MEEPQRRGNIPLKKGENPHLKIPKVFKHPQSLTGKISPLRGLYKKGPTYIKGPKSVR